MQKYNVLEVEHGTLGILRYKNRKLKYLVVLNFSNL